MPSLVIFNGAKYLLSKIRVQAATGTDIAIKREEVVLSVGDTHHNYMTDPAPPQIMVESAVGKEEIPRVVVYNYGGKFYVMSGLELAIEKFKESKSGVIKAKLLSKHMLKKCAEDYEGGTIVTEPPKPAWQRDHNRDERPRNSYNSSVGYNSRPGNPNNRNPRDR
jgi:hypothetical protein